jgi:ketosteroid isomerase-like protein
MKNIALLLLGIFIIESCNQKCNKNLTISKDEMLKIVKECDNKFSVGVKTKNISMLAGIYSDSAQYIPPSRHFLIGKDSINKEWDGFIKMKEKPIDLILNISEVRGNREIIYETGTGYTLLADSAKWKFNYVNVWRLQNDGSYKLEIDTYN